MDKREFTPPPQQQQQLNSGNLTANTSINSFNQGNNSSILHDGLSPTPSFTSMAVLSPPASRYAFDNALTNMMTANIPPIPTLIASPLLSDTNPMNSIQGSLSANNNTNANYYSGENDVPAFEPKTKLILENFTYDLKTFTNWIKNLTIDEQQTTMEIFLNNIHPDAIPFVKNQVDNIDALIKDGNYREELKDINSRGVNEYENNNNNSSMLFSPINDNTQSYAPVRPISPILALNSEPLTLDGLLNDNFHNLNISGGNQIPNSNRMFRNVSNEIIRPKSAGPSYSDFGMTNNNRPQSPLLRVFSPDITSSHNQSNLTPQYQYQNIQQQQQYSSNPYSMGQGNTHNINNNNNNANNSNKQLNNDFASQNAIKLNHSLSTITSRSQLDSSKGGIVNPVPNNLANGNNLNNNYNSVNYSNKQEERGRIKTNNFLNNLNKYKSSNSLPPAPRNNNSNTVNNANYLSPLPPSNQVNQGGPNSLLWKAMNRGQGTNSSGSQSINSISIGSNINNGNNVASSEGTPIIHSPIPTKGGNGSSSNSSGSASAIAQVKSPMPKDIASKKVLENIPMWLKALRLHKYTENLQDLNWKDLIELDDSQLSDLGVSTVGARNKLLKSFVFVKENLHD